MSLELALQANTTAINTLIALLSEPGAVARVSAKKKAQPEVAENTGSGGATVAPVSTASASEGSSSPSAALAPIEKPEPAVQMTAAQAEKALNGHANQPANAPTYQDAAAAITALAKTKGREVAMGVLAQFDKAEGEGKATKLPEVKPSDFAAVIAAAAQAGA